MHSKLNRVVRIGSFGRLAKVIDKLTPKDALSLLFSAILCVALSGCAHEKAEEDPRLEPPLVPVMKVMHGRGAAVSYTGVVKARVESSLGFRVPGKITERLVDTGQVVKRGQILYKMDRTDFVHTMDARKDAVLSQQGSVESKEHAVEAARARLLQAEADEKRYRKALAVGVVTDISYDQYKTAADSARANYTAAEAEVRSAKQLASSLQAQANVAANESSYSTLISDVDGVVTEVLAEPGYVVSAGQTVIKVARSGPREASIELPETVRPKIGSYATATLYNSSIQPCRARLRELSQSADHRTRTFEARYVLDGEAANSPLGATVAVVPEENRSRDEIRIPLTALVDKGDGPGVWIVDPNSSSVRLQPVQISVLGEDDALLSAGPKGDDLLVIQGAHLLHPGERIRTKITNGEFRPVALVTPPHESK